MIVETGEESYETAPGETVVFNPDTEDFNEGRIKLIPKSGEIQFQSVNRGIGTPSYGGTIEVSLYDEGIVVVNEVGIEDYLKKVRLYVQEAMLIRNFLITTIVLMEHILMTQYSFRYIITHSGQNQQILQ